MGKGWRIADGVKGDWAEVVCLYWSLEGTGYFHIELALRFEPCAVSRLPVANDLHPWQLLLWPYPRSGLRASLSRILPCCCSWPRSDQCSPWWHDVLCASSSDISVVLKTFVREMVVPTDLCDS